MQPSTSANSRNEDAHRVSQTTIGQQASSKGQSSKEVNGSDIWFDQLVGDGGPKKKKGQPAVSTSQQSISSTVQNAKQLSKQMSS